MPTSKTCKTEWTWQESIKASWKFSGAMNCPHCHSDQYATPKSRKRMTLINWLVLLPLPFAAIFNLPLVYSISMILILFAVALSLIPKMMELSNEQKPLW
ncbi:TIGR04104 family putative zinc finger protein [Planococcus soli]|uniref:TIGR04104 family putative zinc finger protein n=1 Tax=Planococcus soli TaxID=2666072 RepID=UPI00115CE8A0|nr:TIGR04104 family putative zinc finger protein [Planococcus soli]